MIYALDANHQACFTPKRFYFLAIYFKYLITFIKGKVQENVIFENMDAFSYLLCLFSSIYVYKVFE